MMNLIKKYQARLESYSKTRLIIEMTIIIFILKGSMYEFSELIGLAVSNDLGIKGFELLFVALVVAPLSETALFQALVLWINSKFIKKSWVSIMVSALIFSSIHYDIGISDLIQTFPAGVFFAWMYLARQKKRDSFLTTALTHFFSNAVSLLGFYFISNGVFQ